MEEAYRYEAAVAGDDIASLFAAYILKQNKIRFVILDLEECEEKTQTKEDIRVQYEFPYHVSPEGREKVFSCYRMLAVQLGMKLLPEKHFLKMDEQEEAKDIEGEQLFDLEVEHSQEDRERLEVFFRMELKKELQSRRRVKHLEKKNDYIIVETFFDEKPLDVDVLITEKQLLCAGWQAQSVIEEKERRFDAYINHLRIRKGKKSDRPLVYVTHSKNWFYARETVMQFAVDQGVAAVNPFMNYGFYLNGMTEKGAITECCHQLIRSCEELWVFGPVSEAIMTDIVVAVMAHKTVKFFSISEQVSQIHELEIRDVIFEREVHAGQIRKADLIDFLYCMTPRNMEYVQMSLFD